jgi:hypothetical protein
MHTRLLAGLIASGMLFAPLGLAVEHHRAAARRTMSPDMRRAIEFEHRKALADAHQARIEARHPTVYYNYAERSAQDQVPPGRTVVNDPGEPLWQQHEQNQKIRKQEQQFQRQR